MTHVTLNELANFSRNEQKLIQTVFANEMVEENAVSQGPSDKSLNFIKNYSKVLSVRKSKVLGNITMVLN